MYEIQNSTTFNGAFKVNYKHARPFVREQFESKIKRYNVKIIDKFDGKDKVVMYLLKNSKDGIAADFLSDIRKVRYTYYPNITNNAMFSTLTPQELADYVNTKHPKFIKLLKEMYEVVNYRRELLFSSREQDFDTAQTLLYKLNIKFSSKPFIQDDGILVIKNKNSNGKLEMSPPDTFGYKYVYIKPKNEYDSILRYKINDKGNIIRTYSTPDEMLDFHKEFKKAVSEY